MPLEKGGEATGAVSDGFGVDAHAVQEGEEQIVEGRILRESEVLALLFKRSRAAARQQDRQVIVVMAVAVADACAVDDHGVVEQGAVGFVDAVQLLQEIGDLLRVEFVDLRDLIELVGVTAVVRHIVMAFRHANFRKPITLVSGKFMR